MKYIACVKKIAIRALRHGWLQWDPFLGFNLALREVEAVVGRKIPSLYLKKHNANPHEFYADLLSPLLYDKLLDESRMVLNIAEGGAVPVLKT
jgi:hypothetical protein